ncbi:MAG: VOC family protein [Rhodothermales bacterium]|nr:VOC family protein [Rhodothermales bacterium]
MSEIDHIVLLARDLQEGSDYIQSRLGIIPAEGGKHPDWGTHNALVSIGPSTYLEIIAPDPEADTPKNGRLFEEHLRDQPYIVTWAMRTGDIENVHTRAVSAGIPIGRTESGVRKVDHGPALKWTLTDPHALPFDGIVPFLIDWGETPHPAATSPVAGRLRDLMLFHPTPATATQALDVLGSNLTVGEGRILISATIETADGTVTIS